MLNRNQVVRFMIGKESFGVDIGSVQEIVTLPEITKVPDTPSFLEGVMNLRGRIVSVIDLRKRLGVGNILYGKKNRILVTEVNGKVIGLIVDEVSEVLKLNPESVEPPPEMVSSVGGEFVSGVGKLQERIILLLDLARMLSSEELAKIKNGKGNGNGSHKPETQTEQSERRLK